MATQKVLAEKLNIPRRTVSHYQSLGMPHDLEGATAWLEDYRSKKYPAVGALQIESVPIADGSFDARLERLRGEEMQLAGEIEGTREELVKLSATPVDKDNVADINKRQLVLNNRLALLRRQHLATSKALAEIEQRRAQLSKDVVSVSVLHDTLVRYGSMFAMFCKHLCDEHRECAWAANAIMAEWERNLTWITEELRGDSHNDNRE